MNPKFSKASFENPDCAETLRQELANYVSQRLHEVAKAEFETIICEMNRIGHNLKLYEDDNISTVHYRDFLGEKDKDSYSLLLAFDIVVSALYQSPDS